ncbi:uncharacterized protein LACBIDRAFT_335687 [Laccaria bicolor S238N-H82]|uniref:Predicted protein n=1 Tax=Laccaria bicolor (strain S238N-H82 / ATCC MYA-4686) TaxID=486041 RepID=B0E330_LACBS|nr:uncharacterized protein LACBIDRAFT_335687 [Laccaria bicolor S238N-H82]EDQ98750.1 predicted protein [Laccaria bicolor S238N-H82]|eukprot:XP_001890599.1 predicted protein [Laccaria bicolor S238N-H82]
MDHRKVLNNWYRIKSTLMRNGPQEGTEQLVLNRVNAQAKWTAGSLQGKTFLWLDSLQRRLVWIVLHVPKTLQETVYETVNSSWSASRPKNAPRNRLRNRQLFMEAFLCLDFPQRRLVWILLHVPKTLRQTVYETVNSSWRPSCASISLNVDSFGYYFMSRKRSDKPFTKPSTLRGDLPVSRFPST